MSFERRRNMRKEFGSGYVVGLVVSACLVPLASLAAATSPSTLEVRGDFDGDGFADLAVGVPFESLGAAGHAGGVNVIYGSASGLAAERNQFWSQDSPGVADVAE